MTVVPLIAAAQVTAGVGESWVAVASPLAGLSPNWSEAFNANDASFAGYLGPYLLWIVIYFTIALVLRSLTLATFDRSLGRVRQRSGFRFAAREMA
jgi:hypothetical protein